MLRYRNTQAYIAHTDYLEANEGDFHDYESTRAGSNRYATVLFYLSTPSSGGATVFTRSAGGDADAARAAIDDVERVLLAQVRENVPSPPRTFPP